MWKTLLSTVGQSMSPGLGKDLSECQFDLYNQRVIRLDIERTRPDVELFRSDVVKLSLERVLTVYCKRHLINYKQVGHRSCSLVSYQLSIHTGPQLYLGAVLHCAWR